MASTHSLIGSSLSLSVTTIGAGVLAIPATFESDGVGLVTVVLVAVGVFTVVSIDFLILCMQKLHAHSYEEISDELLGHVFKEIIRWMLVVYNVGTAVGYIVVLGEIFTPMLPLVKSYVPFLSTPSHVMVALWLFVMLPLSFIPRVSGLHFTSFLAILATFFISAIIAYRYFFPLGDRSVLGLGGGENTSPKPDADTAIAFFHFTPRALLALPVVMFSFDCQSLVFQVYTSLDCPPRSDMLKVSVLSVLVTSLVYGLVGFFGYATNTPNVHGNVLTNYNPLKDRLFAVGQTFYSITVMLAYVLILIPVRDAVFQILYGFSYTANGHAKVIPSRVSNLATVGLALLCLMLALLSPGFLFIVAVMGAFCSSTLCFTYPALFRHRMHSLGIAPFSPSERWTVFTMYGFGALGFLLGFYVLRSSS